MSIWCKHDYKYLKEDRSYMGSFSRKYYECTRCNKIKEVETGHYAGTEPDSIWVSVFAVIIFGLITVSFYKCNHVDKQPSTGEIKEYVRIAYFKEINK